MLGYAVNTLKTNFRLSTLLNRGGIDLEKDLYIKLRYKVNENYDLLVWYQILRMCKLAQHVKKLRQHP